MSSHTPGPWTQDPTGDVGWWLIGTADREVAEAKGKDRFSGMTTGEAKANARLISAAPEMFRALVHDGTCAACAEFGHEDCSDCPRRAALAKAEGR